MRRARKDRAPCTSPNAGTLDDRRDRAAGKLVAIAESSAACAVRTYDAGRRGRTRTELTLAEVHVRTGEPRGLMMVRQAIEAVSTLQSVAVRRERLVPLTAALEARPGNDAKEIARIAHQVAATRV